MEDEEEGTSYLADINQAPDFIDEPPLEATEVRISQSLPKLPVLTLCIIHSRLRSAQKPSRPLSTLPPISNFHVHTIMRACIQMMYCRSPICPFTG